MTKQDNDHIPPAMPENHEDNLSRRRLLKILTVSGGAMAAAHLLPGEWVRPVIECGVLPAHAQGSARLTISNLAVRITSLNDCSTGDGNGNGNTAAISLNYSDPMGGVNARASINLTLTFRGDGQSATISDDYSLDAGGWINTVGDGVRGSITMDYCIRFSWATTVTISTRLTNTQRETSNQLSVILNRPADAKKGQDGTQPGACRI